MAKKRLFTKLLLLSISLFFLYVVLVPLVHADNLSSDSYILHFSNFNMTSGTKTSGSYNLTDTNGQTAAGLFGGNTNVKSGFQYIYPFGSPTPSPTPLPPSIIPPIITETINKIIESISPALVAAAPALIVVAAAAQTATSFLPIIFEIISRLLQSIGLIPIKRPRGVVFDTKSGKPIAFATISFIRVSDNEIVDTVISDTAGVYRSIKLPPNVYRIEAIHSDYIFPTKVTPKFLVNPHDFYRGEPFEIRSSNQEELFLIPMDPLLEETVKPSAFYVQIFFSFIRRLVHSLFYPMVVFSVIVTIIFPTPLNIAIIALYAIMIFYRVRHRKSQPLLSGIVIDRYGAPLANTMIRCIESGTNRVGAVLMTDDQGKFKVNLPPHQYGLLVNKDGYVIEQPSQDYTNVFITHTGTEGLITIRMMTVAQAFPESSV